MQRVELRSVLSEFCHLSELSESASRGAAVPELYVGFYWTLPVHWASFRTLPETADAAALKSKTVRYQVEVIRRLVKEERGALIAEIVFIDVSPDRGTEAVTADLVEACRLCKESGATLLWVDFALAFNWRNHPYLKACLEKHGITPRGLYPDPIMLDNRVFCPVRHFRSWRQRHGAKVKALHDQALTELRAAVARHEGEHAIHKAVCDDLNGRGIKTKTGKSWTVATVSKTVKRHLAITMVTTE